jgi:hypothetical protein
MKTALILSLSKDEDNICISPFGELRVRRRAWQA